MPLETTEQHRKTKTKQKMKQKQQNNIEKLYTIQRKQKNLKDKSAFFLVPSIQKRQSNIYTLIQYGV